MKRLKLNVIDKTRNDIIVGSLVVHERFGAILFDYCINDSLDYFNGYYVNEISKMTKEEVINEIFSNIEVIDCEEFGSFLYIDKSNLKEKLRHCLN